MSKITFRADDELITQHEEFDASKSEIMREALREYINTHGSSSIVDDTSNRSDSLDDVVAERIDALVAERLEGSVTPQQPQDVNVNITLDGGFDGDISEEQTGRTAESGASHTPSTDASHSDAASKTGTETGENVPADKRKTCTQCGESLSPSHVYCPNCGEKSSHRVFCECGDELRSDWGFCPSCGRRTPAADVLEER